MQEAITQLVNNGAFWTFLGVAVTSFFGYKEIVKKSPAAKAKQQAKNASSFEELRAVVEVLQSELVKKDKRHKDDTDYILSQLREARKQITSLTNQLAETIMLNGKRSDEIARLKRKLGMNDKPTDIV